ncbi:MAG: glycoside hydrolase family 25 protein [Pyrinomonadaceae bacterium]|nr:glycoside hydrolase family 25 protein [Pyrinomonadaceae bacterium]
MESKIYLRIGFALLLLFAVTPGIAQTAAEFSKPWIDNEKAIVIDAFHKNSIDWRQIKTDRRVAGIIHKATEGTGVSDPKYASRRLLAKRLGYKWGSYHLLRKGETIRQARFYLNKIGRDSSDEIMALDVECTTNSLCNVPKYKVTAEEIATFLKYVKQKTGRYPIFYGNQSVIKDLSKNLPNNQLLMSVPLWYARFKENVTDFPKGIWRSYTLWQFSSEINCKPDEKCLYRVPGTKHDMDINVYNGTIEEMQRDWPMIGQ